jgi:hypothetical protein
MSEFKQGKYLVIKPKSLMTKAEISSILNVAESSVEYIDPTTSQKSSDFYDDLGAAYTAKLNEFIKWDNLQVFQVSGDVKSTFFILKEAELFLGAIELSLENAKKLREQRLIMDRFQFLGNPKSESDKKSLDNAKVEIGTLITNSW